MAQCITITGKGILRVIHGPAAVSPAFDPALDESKRPVPCKVTAIWDTGASGSVVTQSVVDKCGLKQVGLKRVRGVHGEEMSPVYLVNIELPNVGFRHISVTLGKLPPGSDVLIGMDIIAQGDLAITNHGGITVFTFRCPSDGKIDFVAEQRARRATPVKSAPAIGRNATCPCGSGKRYKRCCGEGVH
jgi:Aspartyl protease/SEC-C motif